jgi:hypothetical protein
MLIFKAVGGLVRSYDVTSPFGTITWDATTSAGHPTAPGTYFIRLEAGGVTETRRVVLVR